MSKLHKVFLKKQYLKLIESGKKTVEGRVGKEKFRLISQGDTIEFISSDDKQTSLMCIVTRVAQYHSFRQMLEKEGVNNCLPGTLTIEEGISIYHQFPNYKDGAQKYGVCAFKLKKL